MDFSYRFPAVRGIQANKEYYIAMVPLKHLNKLFENDEEYIPPEYLPTFSSHTIELNLHRIPGLAEHFVYFNDDTFITQNMKREAFFRGELPVLPPQLHGILPRGDTGMMAHVYVNNVSAINRHFVFKKSLRDNRDKWFAPWRIGVKACFENLYCSRYEQFPGFRHTHLPVPLRKRTIARIWDEEPELLDQACSHRFRDARDVNPYLLWQWELAAGEFEPCRPSDLGMRFTISEESCGSICESIRSHRYPLICPNDMGGLEDERAFISIRDSLQDAFEDILPNKSRFEK